MAANVPTILVKKSDGTFVRMSLSDLKKTKPNEIKVAPSQPVKTTAVSAGTSVPKPEPPKPAVAPAAKPAPRPNPVPPKPLPQKKADADFAAPLVEPLAPTVNSGPAVSANRMDQVDAVIKKLSFTVPVQNLNRLRTIIQLRLKEVRSVAQTQDSLRRAELDGGMGLDVKQAEEVLQKCQNNPATPEKIEIIQPLKPRLGTHKSLTEKNLPEIRPGSLPATSTPSNTFVHAPIRPLVIPPAPARPVQPMAPVKSAPVAATEEKPTPAFKLSSAPATKPVMHDVVAKPIEMTPVDEIRYFSLTDFRRLAADPTEAARRLQQKFSHLKDDSIVLYLQGLTAWRTAPLYVEYLNTVLTTLNNGQKLTVPRDRPLIQFNELAALVAMEQTMEYV